MPVDAYGVQCRPVHDHQSLLRWSFREGDNLAHRCRTSLEDGPQRFLLESGQAALDVPRRRLRAPHVDAGGEDGALHIAYDLVEARTDVVVGGPPGKDVLRADHLRDLRDHHRATCAHQEIGGDPGSGIGRQTGEGVRTSAFHPHGQSGDVHRCPPVFRRGALELLQQLPASGDGRRRATLRLYFESLEALAGLAQFGRQHFRGQQFAAQTHEKHSAHVGVRAEAGHGAQHELPLGAQMAAAMRWETLTLPGTDSLIF